MALIGEDGGGIMRLIDADKLVERFPVGDPVSTAKIRWEIENEPTVDAVPVVRCKDCKWAYDKIGYNLVCCFDGTSTSSDWFCERGRGKMKFDVSRKEIDIDALVKIINSVEDKEDIRICMNMETTRDCCEELGMRLDNWEYYYKGHIVEIDETLNYGEIELR